MRHWQPSSRLGCTDSPHAACSASPNICARKSRRPSLRETTASARFPTGKTLGQATAMFGTGAAQQKARGSSSQRQQPMRLKKARQIEREDEAHAERDSTDRIEQKRRVISFKHSFDFLGHFRLPHLCCYFVLIFFTLCKELFENI